MQFILAGLLLLLPVEASPSLWPVLSQDARPVGGGVHDAAVIVAIEEYTYLSGIHGARRNARDWYWYFTSIRGIPDGHVYRLLDTSATPAKMRTVLGNAAKAVGTTGTLWFVFIGHGAPSRNDPEDVLLVGVDAHADVLDFYPHTLPRKEVLAILSGTVAKAQVAVLDACFSGRDREEEPLLKDLQFVVPTHLSDTDRTTVLAAGADFTGPLPGERRPSFSYFVLGALLGWGDRDGDKRISASETVAYAASIVNRLINDRRQEPMLTPS